MDLKIKESELLELIKKELPKTTYLKGLQNIEKYLINQAKKESSLFIYSTRYESHLDDMSVGLYQMLIQTMKWMGYLGNVITSFNIEVQIKYALKYLDFLYSKFPEIKNKTERLKMAFGAYNCGRKNVNDSLKQGRELEEIHYEGSNTLQGKWSTYDNVNKMMLKYNIIKEKNADINKRYIDYIFNV